MVIATSPRATAAGPSTSTPNTTNAAAYPATITYPATETPIRGADLERASAAALEHTGGGAVTGTEVDDEESYYEVEVTLDDGSQVDVQLDRDFQVVGSETDHEDDAADDD